MAKRFFEIFRAGKYPQGNIDEEDVKRIAESYDPSFLEAPVTLDHDWGGPAWAWVDELRAEGGRLLASFKDASDYIISLTATKQYKRHSVELYNDLEGKGPYLKAVSLLGALTPQVKGMEPIEFSSFSENFPDDPTATYEFDEPAEPVEETDESETPEDKPDEGTTEPVEEGAQEVPGSTETPEGGTEDGGAESDGSAHSDGEDETEEFSEADLTAMQQRIDNLQTELDRFKGEANRFRDENQRIKFDQRKKDFETFLDKQISEHKRLLPKLKDKAMALFAHLDKIPAGKDGQKSALQLFKDFVSGLPEIDLETERAREGETVDFGDPHALAAEIEAYQDEQAKKGRTVSTSEALHHIKKTRKA